VLFLQGPRANEARGLLFCAMTRGERWPALLAVNVAAAIFGSTALFGKLDVSPVWIVAGRGGFAAATLYALALLRHAQLRVARADVLAIAATGALLALHWVSFFLSVQQAGVAVATLTFASFPLMTLLIDASLNRRRPSGIELASGAAIVVAVFLLVGPGLPAVASAREGTLIGLLSALCFALFSVGSQRLAHGNVIALSLYQNIAVVLLLLPVLAFVPRAPHGADWAALAALGVVATALMHQLYFFALKRLPAAVCGGFVALEPVYAILFAALLFAEPVRPLVILSAALILGASFLLLFRGQRAAITVP
jgi:drug/metabolite transporter (DMT)-like permease